MAMGVLGTAGLAVTVPDPAGGRSKTARLTLAGTAAQQAFAGHLAACERWPAVRDMLAELPLAAPDPYPDGWRASVRRPDVLPFYPAVLHRGGYPDGS